MRAPENRNGVPPRVKKLLRSLILLACFAAADAGAQSLAPRPKERPELKEKDQREREPAIPKQYMPPRGMCRIWVDNVPATRQPAPTDCNTAIRNRPPNARVIFGPGRTNDSKATPPRPKTDTIGKRKPPR